jgi:hypothetical protein
MKSVITFISILFLSTITYSQKCKYETNDIDTETKLPVKVTKMIRVYATFNTTGVMSISNINNNYTIDFCHVVFAGCVTTYEGCEITFLLENGESITLKKGKINYSIQKENLHEILKSKVKKIQYQYGDNITNSKSTVTEVNSKKGASIIELIKCVL